MPWFGRNSKLLNKKWIIVAVPACFRALREDQAIKQLAMVRTSVVASIRDAAR
jgi:hypothetical protein